MKRVPHLIDIRVGKAIRVRRELLWLTQRDLADHLGVTYQQIQNYETAADRVPISRLYEIATLLRVAISYFFEQCPRPDPTLPHEAALSAARSCNADPKETLDLVSAICRIRDRTLRKRVIQLVELASDCFDAPSGDPESGSATAAFVADPKDSLGKS